LEDVQQQQQKKKSKSLILAAQKFNEFVIEGDF
jgi:hypothetical protein